jgi:hypothetical protein
MTSTITKHDSRVLTMKNGDQYRQIVKEDGTCYIVWRKAKSQWWDNVNQLDQKGTWEALSKQAGF